MLAPTSNAAHIRDSDRYCFHIRLLGPLFDSRSYFLFFLNFFVVSAFPAFHCPTFSLHYVTPVTSSRHRVHVLPPAHTLDELLPLILVLFDVVGAWDLLPLVRSSLTAICSLFERRARPYQRTRRCLVQRLPAAAAAALSQDALQPCDAAHATGGRRCRQDHRTTVGSNASGRDSWRDSGEYSMEFSLVTFIS